MRRKSTGLASQRTLESDKGEIKNTGLRPTWDEFWTVDADEFTPLKAQRYKKVSRTFTGTLSATSKSDTVFRVMKFISGSEWCGEWDKLGMSGTGEYKLPTGVVYDGTMSTGEFEGIGVLKYPNGGNLEGFWHEGKLKYCQYEYADGLKRDNVVSWPYCQVPDRRFHPEIKHGLKAANNEQVSNEDPPRDLPPGYYDVGDGMYNPRTKCVIDPSTKEVLRIPTVADEEWILENCRKDEISTVGYKPELYENWYHERDPEDLMNRNISEHEKEILALIQQEGGNLVPRTSSYCCQDKANSWQLKLDNISLRELRSLGSIWSKSDLESILKKAKVREQEKGSSSILVSDDVDESLDDLSMIKLLQDIALSYSGKSDKIFNNKSSSVLDIVRHITSFTGNISERMRTLTVDSAFERDIMHSESSAPMTPFVFEYPKSDYDGENGTAENIASLYYPVENPSVLKDRPLYVDDDDDSNKSEVRLSVDYSDYSADLSDYVP